MAVRRALIISTIDRYFTLAANLSVALVVSRILTPAEIGVSVVGTAILGVALSVREFASSNFLVQQPLLTRDDIRASFSVMLSFTALVAAFLVLFSPALARVYGQANLISYFHVISVCLFTDLVSIQVIALLRREMAYGRIAAIDIAGAAVTAVLTIGLALRGASYMSFAWAWLGGSIATATLSLAIGHKLLWMFVPSLKNWRPMLKFGWYNGAIALLSKGFETTPYILLGGMISPNAAALFNRGLMVCQIPDKVILSGALSVVLPAFAEESRKGNRLDRPYLHSMEIITALYWPALLSLAVLAHPVVGIVLGKQWQEVVPIVQVVAIASLVSFGSSINYPVIVAMGELKQAFVRAALSLPISTMIMALGIFLGGPYGAACSLIIIIPFQVAVTLSYLSRRLLIHPRDLIRSLWRSALVAVLTPVGPLCVILMNGFDWRLSPGQAVIAATMAGAFWLLGLFVSRHPIVGEAIRFKLAAQRRLTPGLKGLARMVQ